MDPKSINWETLDFSYKKTPYRFHARWKDGKWDQGKLVEENMISIEESATALHYGQQCFEGMKAQRSKDGKVLLFRPEDNGKRLKQSAERLMMPAVPMDLFMKGVTETVKANSEFVPPYGHGASLYIRPLLIGTGHNLGVKTAPEFLFLVFVVPVGPYFKEGFKTIKLKIETYFDRAAPHGIGNVKAGGNYSASLLPVMKARQEGFNEVLYLDAKEHKYFEEAGAANIFFLMKDGSFVTPESEAILRSITRRSVMEVAEKDFNLKVQERKIGLDELDDIVEAGACGTAAVVTPVGLLGYKDKLYKFYADGNEPGPTTSKIYKHLTGIQVGDIEDTHGWTVEVE